jgi:hypothetical protein
MDDVHCWLFIIAVILLAYAYGCAPQPKAHEARHHVYWCCEDDMLCWPCRYSSRKFDV